MLIKVRELKNHERVVAGVTVTVTEAIWTDEMVTWEVFHKESGKALGRSEECNPSDEEIIVLLEEYVGWWICQGCAKTYRAYQKERVQQHVKECDLWAFWLSQTR